MYLPIRETEIRPEHLEAKQAVLFANDVQRLLKSRGDFVAVSCPACGSNSVTEIWHKYGLDYPVCSKCSTMYISPRPTPAILEDHYSWSENYWYWNKYIFPESERARREKIFKPRALRLAEIA